MADLEKVASDLNSASQSLQELREKYNGALDLLDNKNTEITGALESAKSNALQEVQTASDTATSQISQLKDTSLNLVNEAKNTATTEISSKKEEALSQIEQAKTEQGEKITALEQAKENIITELTKKAKLLTSNINLTVGNGGTCTKLSDAISEALKYKPGTGNITITLKTGFIWNELINITNKDLSYISINSEDSEVTADGSIMTSSSSNQYFLSLDNSRGLTFNVLLNCINMSGTIYKHGILVTNGAFISIPKGFGCKGANWNILVGNCSTTNLYEAVFDNAIKIGILVQNSIANARQSSLKNCLDIGCSVGVGGILNASYCDFTGTSIKSNIPFNQISSNGIIFNESNS